MEDYYPKAYKETYEIIKCLPKEDLNKIPNEMIDMLKTNMDKNYQYELDKTKPFEEQIMLKETKEILAIFYRDYWAAPEEKNRIKNKIQEDIKKAESLKSKKYDDNNIFKNKTEDGSKSKIISLSEYKKETWYLKIFRFIGKLLNRK